MFDNSFEYLMLLVIDKPDYYLLTQKDKAN